MATEKYRGMSNINEYEKAFETSFFDQNLNIEQAGEENAEKGWMWLCGCPGMYRIIITALLGYFGSPENVIKASDNEIMAWKKIGDGKNMVWVDRMLSYRSKFDCAEKAWEYFHKREIMFVSKFHPYFPESLKHIPDCPFGLFYRGSLPEPSLPTAAIIGARRCSNYGQQIASSISRSLTRAGFQIISGMAIGIDGTAQSACVSNGGRSFAVLGSGVDVCYPIENRKLFDILPKSGGIISELPPGTQPLKHHFPIRNRLISGLSDTVIVVEARQKSGSLITADFALDQGKEVYAVPGRYGDLLSWGCNHLISQGAGIVLSSEDLLDNLAITLNMKNFSKMVKAQKHRGSETEQLKKEGMNDEEKKVFGELDFDARSIDEIATSCGLTLLQTMSALLSLELTGHATEVSKNRFARKLAR